MSRSEQFDELDWNKIWQTLKNVNSVFGNKEQTPNIFPPVVLSNPTDATDSCLSSYGRLYDIDKYVWGSKKCVGWGNWVNSTWWNVLLYICSNLRLNVNVCIAYIIKVKTRYASSKYHAVDMLRDRKESEDIAPVRRWSYCTNATYSVHDRQYILCCCSLHSFKASWGTFAVKALVDIKNCGLILQAVNC